MVNPLLQFAEEQNIKPKGFLPQESSNPLLDFALEKNITNITPTLSEMETTNQTMQPTGKIPIIDQPPLSPAMQVIEKGVQAGKDFTTEAAKGAAESLKNISSLGERGLRAASNILFPGKPFGEQTKSTGAERIIPEMTTPTTVAGQLGRVSEQIAEFLIPAAKIGKALEKAPFVARVAGRGLTGAGIATAQEGKFDDKAKTVALIEASFPFLESAVSKLGHKILFSAIKPGRSEIEQGFEVTNIEKYKLGGTLKQMLVNTSNKMSSLADKLKKVLSQAPQQEIDLLDVAIQTEKEVLQNLPKKFGNIESIKKVLGQLTDELSDVSMTGKADILTSQFVKQGAGNKGAWVYGRTDPDATAVEYVYTKFYQKMRQALENVGGKEVKIINSQLGDLIPIQNALIRRIPVAERQNVLGLSDNIFLFAGALNPNALVLAGVNRILKSPLFANIILKAKGRLGGTGGAILSTF